MSVSRSNAVTGEQIILVAYFRYDRTGQLFDPDGVNSVEIWNEDKTAILETLTSITRLTTGTYQVITSSTWNTTSRTVWDFWKITVQGVDHTLMLSTFIASAGAAPTPAPASLPTPADVRSYLEGYCTSSSIISDDWIEEVRDREVVPFVEQQAGTNFTAEQIATEYHNGIAWDRLILNRRNATRLISVNLVSSEDITAVMDLSSLLLIADEGVIKVKSGMSEFEGYRSFPKGHDNIVIRYAYGGTLPYDLAYAVKLLCCIKVLDIIEGRTGGGDLNVQSFGRNYGAMGKYTHIRHRLYQQAMYIVRRYQTAVIGS